VCIYRDVNGKEAEKKRIRENKGYYIYFKFSTLSFIYNKREKKKEKII